MFREREIRFGKYSINTKSAGIGNKAIFFVHGNSQTAESWDLQLMDESLSAQYQLISFDLPGHGGSDWVSDNVSLYTPKEFAKVTETVIESYGIEEYLLAGLSYGTNVISEITGPLKGCKGIVLASSCIVSNDVPPPVVFAVIDAMPVNMMASPSDADLEKFCSYIINADESLSVRYIESYKGTDPLFREELGKVLMSGGWGDELNNISNRDIPVLVIFGKEEKLVHTHYLDNYSPLWHKKAYLIEGAGHLVNQEKPEEFNQLLLSFAQEILR